jgi:hypothetical protein
MIIDTSFSPFPIYVQFRYPRGRSAGVTECKLLKYEDNAKAEDMLLLGQGLAFCHANDNPDKEKGRKIALARAIDDASAEFNFSLKDRASRREIWNAYHSRSPKYANYINHGKAA